MMHPRRIELLRSVCKGPSSNDQISRECLDEIETLQKKIHDLEVEPSYLQQKIAYEKHVQRSYSLKLVTPSNQVIPITERRSVLLDWVHGLTFMQQSVLIAAIRGPDGIKKDHPVKVLCRWLRRCVLINAFNRTEIGDPYTAGGGSFTGPCALDAKTNGIHGFVEVYLRHVDELPHHFQLHFMHAAEIIGYKHPFLETRNWWHATYLKIVSDAHLHPETEFQMDTRLGDNEAAWRNAEVVTAK